MDEIEQAKTLENEEWQSVCPKYSQKNAEVLSGNFRIFIILTYSPL